MTSNNYPFVPADVEELTAQLTASYEAAVGSSVSPASPEKLLIQWLASILVQERVHINYAGNQNIPSRASGENLDALAELVYSQKRPEAVAATCVIRFEISEAQTFPVAIPAGTRVTDSSGTLVWETWKDAQIPAGLTAIEMQVRCQTAGTVGNGYAVGQISTVVDLYDYCSGCSNRTVSGGGSDRATDAEFYEQLRLSMDSRSTAGAVGSYLYFAKQVSTEIADVAVTSPEPGTVNLYVLTKDGAIAGEELKAAVLAACSADTVRPLTDLVQVKDPETAPYDIRFTYFLQENSGISDVKDAVQAAVDEYTAWQSGKLGRDINPSVLVGKLMRTGVKRVELEAPAFQRLNSGTSSETPQVAKLGTVSITNGGYEQE